MPWFNIVVALLGILGALSAALVYIRGNLAKSTIEALETNQRALNSRIDTLSAENGLLQKRVVALEHTKDELFLQVKSLPAFAHMAESMQSMSDQMGEVLMAIVSLTERLEKRA